MTFVPSPGIIRHLNLPGGPGVRIDTFVHEGCEISPYYDSLIAKLMTYGRDRAEAIARMRRCLDVMVVEGIKTNIPLHRRIMDDPDFLAGRLDTRFMERFLARAEGGAGCRLSVARRSRRRPFVYPIVDAALLGRPRAGAAVAAALARRRRAAACRCAPRTSATARLLALAREARGGGRARGGALLVVNDRPDVARLWPAPTASTWARTTSARATRGGRCRRGALVGLSTHTLEQLEAAAGRAGGLRRRRARLRHAHQGGRASRWSAWRRASRAGAHPRCRWWPSAASPPTTRGRGGGGRGRRGGDLRGAGRRRRRPPPCAGCARPSGTRVDRARGPAEPRGAAPRPRVHGLAAAAALLPHLAALLPAAAYYFRDFTRDLLPAAPLPGPRAARPGAAVLEPLHQRRRVRAARRSTRWTSSTSSGRARPPCRGCSRCTFPLAAVAASLAGP